MYARLPRCAPTARNTASKRPSCIVSSDARHLAVELERDPEVEDPLDLGVEDVARQPVLRDPEAHHAAGPRAGVVDRHVVAETGEVVRGGEPGRAGADDEHALAGRRRGDLDLPALRDRLVAEEPLDRVDPDRLVELGAVADALARVVADPAHHGRERVVLHDLAPGALVARRPPPRPRRATAGCSRRPGTRCCTAAAGGRTPGARSASCPSCWRGSSRRRA